MLRSFLCRGWGREGERERAVNKNCSATCIPQLDVPTASDDDVHIRIVRVQD